MEQQQPPPESAAHTERRERLLVCVGPGPMGERLVRAAKRLADGLSAEWVAAYVETPRTAQLPQVDQDSATRSLRLAEELGARVEILAGRTVAAALIHYSRKAGVTKIVAGKPLRRGWRDVLSGSPVDEIIRDSGGTDIHVISSGLGAPARLAPEARQPRPVVPYCLALGMTAAATVAGWRLHRVVEPTNLVMLYLAVVLVAAVNLGRGPAILSSIAGMLAFDFFVIDPQLTLAVADTQYVLTFIGLLATGLVTSTLVSQVRAQAEAARRRAAQTAALYDLARDLSALADVDQLAGTVSARASAILSADVRVVLHGRDGRDAAAPLAPEAFRLPIAIADRELGVLDVRCLGGRELSESQRQLVEGFAQLAALALERLQLHEQARRAMVLAESERIQAALLDSVSHELRTPLALITGVLSALLSLDGSSGELPSLAPEAREELLRTAQGEADRLDRLVGNLLDMTRLESGLLTLRVEPCDVEDLVGSALQQVANRLGDRSVHVAVASPMPLVPMDFVLMVQVLANLIDNAGKFSPPHTPIEVSATCADGLVSLAVVDRGPGIPPEERERVFVKFHRVPGIGETGGTGLGLAIARAIVEAHGGAIRVESGLEGGASLVTELPLLRPEGTGKHP